MRITGNKRLLGAAGGAAAVGAAATLVAGVTFALFSAQQANTSNAFTAGSESLTQTSAQTCTLSAVQPGDGTQVGTLTTAVSSSASPASLAVTSTTRAVSASDVLELGYGSGTSQQLSASATSPGSTSITVSGWGGGGAVTNYAVGTPVFDLTTHAAGAAGTCTLPWTYSGVNAAVGVDVVVTSITTASSIPTPYGGAATSAAGSLFDATANGLQVMIANSAGSPLVNGTTYLSEGSSAATALTTTVNGGVNDLLLNAGTASSSGTVTLDWFMPNTSSSNNYINAAVTFKLLVHTVQTAHNSLPGDAAVGHQANVNGNGSTFSWS